MRGNPGGNTSTHALFLNLHEQVPTSVATHSCTYSLLSALVLCSCLSAEVGHGRGHCGNHCNSDWRHCRCGECCCVATSVTHCATWRVHSIQERHHDIKKPLSQCTCKLGTLIAGLLPQQECMHFLYAMSLGINTGNLCLLVYTRRTPCSGVVHLQRRMLASVND